MRDKNERGMMEAMDAFAVISKETNCAGFKMKYREMGLINLAIFFYRKYQSSRAGR